MAQAIHKPASGWQGTLEIMEWPGGHFGFFLGVDRQYAQECILEPERPELLLSILVAD
jgi:hypothetical protein